MKSKYIFLFILLAACSAGNKAMTAQNFFEIPIGSTSKEVQQMAGKPYRIHKKRFGEVEYEYIERYNVGGRVVNEKHYFVIFKDGKVVGKRTSAESTPPYNIDSYELQTSSKDQG